MYWIKNKKELRSFMVGYSVVCSSFVVEYTADKEEYFLIRLKSKIKVYW